MFLMYPCSPALSGAQRVIMYTYGAPRVGNKAFADAFDARLSAAGAAWRITNIRDIVPTVPRLMGYAHGGSSVRLTGGGGLLVGAAAEAEVLVEGREVLEVLGVSCCFRGEGGPAQCLQPPMTSVEGLSTAYSVHALSCTVVIQHPLCLHGL
jgi:hypothetical protein